MKCGKISEDLIFFFRLMEILLNILIKKNFHCLWFIFRCDLVISANGKTEKIASGLLNPFLAHLKAARDQMAKGGYSIILEPEAGRDAAWFTKATVER